MLYTRRDFGKLALATVPATKLLLDSDEAFATALAKPNSKWAGVQVGMNVPYNFKAGNYMSADEVLKRCVALNISGVELRAQPIELFLGSPVAVKAAASAAAGGGRGGGRGGAAAAPQGAAAPSDVTTGAPARGGGRAAGGRGAAPVTGGAEADAAGAPAARGGGRAAQTPEQQAAAKADTDATRTWRMGVSMDKVKEFRKVWNDAGVNIDVIKWDGIFDFSDEEMDYAFQVSKALGANGLSSEISIGRTKRLGSFADKHKMPVGYHGHAAVSDEIWEATFAEAKYNYANVDLGHYVAGQNKSPVPFIKKHPDRITHVHVKDRKLNEGPNMPFGQGDTPIKEVLQLMRANKWKFDATIEFEYGVPQGSDLMTELAKTVQYCKDCLV